MEKVEQKKNALKAKTDVVEVFCSETKIKPFLKRKVVEALEYNSGRNVFSWIESGLFNEIPIELKYAICTEIHDGVIGRHDFFAGKSPEFTSLFVPLLMPLKVEANDVLYVDN